MGSVWAGILSSPLASQIQSVLTSGDKTLYALWLCQVSHLTKHTSAHQALVGTRISEVDHRYAKFCYEHALEEVGHELMAVHDLKKMGYDVAKIEDLPPPLAATEKLTAYLYYVSERGHPLARLGFSYWAEKCYPFLAGLADQVKESLDLSNREMTFFVSHAQIDEKHADDVERILKHVCKTPEDWAAVERGMADTMELSVGIFKEVVAELSAIERGASRYEVFATPAAKIA